MVQWKKIWSWIFIALGLLTFGYQTFEHYYIKFVRADSLLPENLCKIGQSWDCTSVYLSRYASIGDIPVSMFALWFFLVLLCVRLYRSAILWGGEESTLGLTLARIHLMHRIAAVVLIVGTMIMAFLSFAIIKTLCILCVTGYVVTLGLALILLAEEAPFSKDQLGRQVRGLLLARFPYFWLGSLIIGVLLTHLVLYKSVPPPRWEWIVEDSLRAFMREEVQQFEAEPAYRVEGRTTTGDAEAPRVIVTEFIDLFCPFCVKSSELIEAYTKTRPSLEVRVYFYPLDGNCNPELSYKSPSSRCDWTKYVLCKPASERRDLVHWIFKNQSELLQASFEEGLKRWLKVYKGPHLGLEKEFRREGCDEAKVDAHLKSMIAEAKHVKVEGTPTVFINGRRLSGAVYPPVLHQIIDYLAQP